MTGDRVPLTFESRDQFEQFKAALRAVFAKHGITDATVQQIGSATTGWRGNPDKPLVPWKPSSDANFVISSDEAMVQLFDIRAEVNRRIVQGGRYVFFKNRADGGRGFYATPLGKDLQRLAREWTMKIHGDENVDGFDFKMSLGDMPFPGAVYVMRPADAGADGGKGQR